MKKTLFIIVALFYSLVFCLADETNHHKATIVFHVPEDGTFETAIETANADTTDARFCIYMKNYTGNQYSTLTLKRSNVSIIDIGLLHSTFNDYISNDKLADPREGLHKSNVLTIDNGVTGTLLDGLFFINTENSANSLLEDYGDKTICDKLLFKGYQCNYFSGSNRHYLTSCTFYGYQDIVCGDGDCYLDICNFTLTRDSASVAAPDNSGAYGLVFDNCSFDPEHDNYKYWLGRPWGKGTSSAYILNPMYVHSGSAPEPEGWLGFYDCYPKQLAEGIEPFMFETSNIDLSQRKKNFEVDGVNHENNPFLSEEEMFEMSKEKVIGGDDNWDPEALLRTLPAPSNIQTTSTGIKWDDDSEAICWYVWKDNNIVQICEEPEIDLAIAGQFTIQAVNSLGLMGEQSDAIEFFPVSGAELHYIYNDKKQTATVTYACSEVNEVRQGNNNYVGDIVIPEKVTYNDLEYTVTKIGSEAFEKSLVTSIKMPNTITSIDGDAFENCAYLTNIEFSTALTSIGMFAFSDCKSLEDVTLPEGLKTLEEHAFSWCENLRNVTLPQSLKTIGEGVFEGCDKLQSAIYVNGNFITLPTGYEGDTYEVPEGITTIKSKAFSYNNVTKIILSNTVKTIEPEAFYCCNIEDIDLGNSVETIYPHAFTDCTMLKSLTLPASVKSVTKRSLKNYNGILDGSIFYHCDALESLKVAEDNPIFDSRDNCNAVIETSTNTLIMGTEISVIPNTVTSIGKYAFNEQWGRTSIVIPTSVTYIDEYAFENNANLTDINILVDDKESADSVSNGKSDEGLVIGRLAFSACTSLKKLVLPSRVTELGRMSFNACLDLEEVIISSNLKKIDTDAFFNCPSLKNIVLSDSLANLGDSVFYQTGIESITSPAMIPPVATEKTFDGVSEDIPVSVPSESIDAYRQAVGWSKFNNFVAIKYEEDGIEDIESEYESKDANKMYNVLGQQLSRQQKGIIIRNGKKIYVK